MRLPWIIVSAGGLLLLAATGAAWRTLGRAGLVQGPITASIGFGEDWSDRALAESHRIGAGIVAAVDRYRRANGGELPPSLDAMVPSYLSAIEPATVGDHQWRLGVLSGHGSEYYLSVRSRFVNAAGYHGIQWTQYNSLDGKWVVFRDESLLFD